MEPNVNMKALFLRKVTLNDGTVFVGSAALTPDGDTLVVNLDEGPELVNVFMAFNDPEKTSVIVSTVESQISNAGDARSEFNGFTRLVNVGMSGKNFRIILKKPIV